MTPDSDKLYELIEAWLDDQLPPEEAAAFGARVLAEEDLRFRVEQHRLARGVIGHWVADDYKSKIKDWKKELEELPQPKPSTSFIKWWVIAVSFLVIAVGAISVWYWGGDEQNKTSNPVQQTKPSGTNTGQEETKPAENEKQKQPPRTNNQVELVLPKKKKGRDIAQKEDLNADETNMTPLLASVYDNMSEFKIYLDESLDTRGDEEPQFKVGKTAFLKGDFKAVIKQLEFFPETSPNFTAALQLLAFSSYKIGDYKKAVDYYEQFAPRKIGQDTDWWLVQFYLMDYNNKKNDFWEKFNKILNNGAHRYNPQAQEIKAEMESLGIREK